MSFGQKTDTSPSEYAAYVFIYSICFVYALCACVASYLFLKRSDRLVKEAFEKEQAERQRLLGVGERGHVIGMGGAPTTTNLAAKRLLSSPSGLAVAPANGNANNSTSMENVIAPEHYTNANKKFRPRDYHSRGPAALIGNTNNNTASANNRIVRAGGGVIIGGGNQLNQQQAPPAGSIGYITGASNNTTETPSHHAIVVAAAAANSLHNSSSDGLQVRIIRQDLPDSHSHPTDSQSMTEAAKAESIITPLLRPRRGSGGGASEDAGNNYAGNENNTFCPIAMNRQEVQLPSSDSTQHEVIATGSYTNLPVHGQQNPAAHARLLRSSNGPRAHSASGGAVRYGGGMSEDDMTNPSAALLTSTAYYAQPNSTNNSIGGGNALEQSVQSAASHYGHNHHQQHLPTTSTYQTNNASSAHTSPRPVLITATRGSNAGSPQGVHRPLLMRNGGGGGGYARRNSDVGYGGAAVSDHEAGGARSSVGVRDTQGKEEAHQPTNNMTNSDHNLNRDSYGGSEGKEQPWLQRHESHFSALSLNHVDGVADDFEYPTHLLTQDRILRFFLFLVAFLISRSISTLVNVMMGDRSIFSQEQDDIDSRNYQDLFFSVSTFLYYCLPLVLLHTFASILERVSGKSEFRRAVIGIFIVQFTVYWIITLLLAFKVPHTTNSLEYVGVVISVGYVFLYIYAARYFPNELLKFGPQLLDVSRRIRSSSIVFAVCMGLRVIVILPSLQDKLTNLLTPSGILAVYMPLDLAPTAICMYVLHKRQDNPSNNGNKEPNTNSNNTIGTGDNEASSESDNLYQRR